METNATPNAARPKSRRRWCQFSLRTLLLGVTLAGVACAVGVPAVVRWQRLRERATLEDRMDAIFASMVRRGGIQRPRGVERSTPP